MFNGFDVLFFFIVNMLSNSINIFFIVGFFCLGMILIESLLFKNVNVELLEEIDVVEIFYNQMVECEIVDFEMGDIKWIN